MPVEPHIADSDLVTRLQAGERTEYHWRLLVERHRLRVLANVRRLVRNQDAAMDLAQDTFVRLFELLRKRESIENLPGLLYQISGNLALDYLRVQARDKQRVKEIEKKLEKSWPDIVHNEALFRLYNREVDEQDTRLRLAMRELSEPQRQAIQLFYHRGLSYREIAENLNMPIDGVRSALQNGRLKLKRLLEKSESAGSGR